MKEKLLIFLMFMLVIVSTGCNNDIKFKLKVKETTWSGWTENYKSEEKTEEYDVELNKKYVFKSNFNDNFTFTVEEINKDNIVIRTEEPFSDKESGIDLSETKKTFKIYIDKETILNTITMDAGATYYLTIEK